MNTKQVLTALALLAFSGIAAAQTPAPNPSLTPPGAPVDGVFKTLDQVEARIPLNASTTPPNPGRGVAFEIATPGSYYLTANIQITSGIGIEISADHVSLDLNGFAVLGGEGIHGTSGTTGILITGDDARVRDGSVSGWANGGIVQHDTATGAAVERITAVSNGGSGIRCDLATACAVRGNGGDGIEAQRVKDCFAAGNGFSRGFRGRWQRDLLGHQRQRGNPLHR